MENIIDKYRFNDFTLKNYKRILTLAKTNYKFICFDNVWPLEGKNIILRHDIEFSVPIAVRMAEIESSMGIKAIYFVQLHGDFYNALEKRIFQQIKKIESLGHQLALHFDSHFWDITNEKELEKFLIKDKDTFEKYFQFVPVVFSFHNNNKFTLSCEEDSYAGMINVYSKKYKNEIGYCSDSIGYWRYEVLEEKLGESKDQILQILIHDAMWQDEVQPPRRRIYKVIDDHADFMKKSYDDTLKKFGAKNIDWEGEV